MQTQHPSKSFPLCNKFTATVCIKKSRLLHIKSPSKCLTMNNTLCGGFFIVNDLIARTEQESVTTAV